MRRRSKLSENIVEEIIDFINEKEIKIGEKLPTEESLCQILEVSRAPLREGLRILEFLGIIESHQGIGRFVTTDPGNALRWQRLWSDTSLWTLVEARVSIESAALQLAVDNGTEEDIAKMATIIQRLSSLCDDPDAFFWTEVKFHRILGQMTGNVIIEEMINLLIHKSIEDTEVFYKSTKDRPLLQRTLEQLQGILRSIQEGDKEEAIHIMKIHLSETVQAALLQDENQD